MVSKCATGTHLAFGRVFPNSAAKRDSRIDAVTACISE